MEWLGRLPPARIRADPPRRPIRTALRRTVGAHDDVGDPGAGDHQRTARARRDARHEPLRSRRALRPRQGQAVEQGRASARARRRGAAEGFRFRHAPPPWLSVAALVRRGAAGRASATISSAPRTSSTRWTPASRRSAPTPTNCRWSTPRSPTTTRRCAQAPYEVLRDWARMYGGNLLVVLPDCFGSTDVPGARARLGRGLEGRAARIRRSRWRRRRN